MPTLREQLAAARLSVLSLEERIGSTATLAIECVGDKKVYALTVNGKAYETAADGRLVLDGLPGDVTYAVLRTQIPAGWQYKGGKPPAPIVAKAGEETKVVIETEKAAAAPPVPAPPPIHARPGQRQSVKPAAPFARGESLRCLDIDASLVGRVLDLPWKGGDILVEDVNATNFGKKCSFIEQSAEGIKLVLRRVNTGDTPRYSVFSEYRTKGAAESDNSKPFNRVEIYECRFGSSHGETPLRFRGGTDLIVDKTKAIDSVDIGSNKANQGFRFHGYRAVVTSSHFGKFTKVGVETLDANQRTRLFAATNTTFDGGIQFENVERVVLDGCRIDGTQGASGWALSRAEGGWCKGAVVEARNCTFVGQIDLSLFAKHEGCTLNGKPL